MAPLGRRDFKEPPAETAQSALTCPKCRRGQIKSKKGSNFDARLKLGPECKAAFDFPADAR